MIAAYNEEGAIGPVIEALPAEVCGLATAAVVVADGCADGTAAEAAAAGAMVCDVPVNRGQGAALRLGYRLAREGGAELHRDDRRGRPVQPGGDGTGAGAGRGRRGGLRHRLPDGSAARRPRTSIRRSGVRFFASTISLLTGQKISDTTFGLRAMRAEVTGAVRLEQPQYQASELLIGVITHGYKVAEVPATIHRRRVGESKKGQNPLYGLHLPGREQLLLRAALRPGGVRHLVARAAAGRAAGQSESAGSSSGMARSGPVDSAARTNGSGPGSVETSASSAAAGSALPGRGGEEDVVEEQEPHQERAQVGHAIHRGEVQRALRPVQVPPGRRVVAEVLVRQCRGRR